MYVALVKAGISLFGLGVLIYTAFKTHKVIQNRYSEGKYLPISSYTEKKAGNNENCLLCLDKFDFRKCDKVVLPCKHKFHRNCISTAFGLEKTSRRQCPSCLVTISEDFIKSNIF